MSLTAAAEKDLRAVLKAFGAAHSGIIGSKGAGKALEAWILLKLAQTVDQHMPKWTVSLRRGDGSLLPPGASFDLPNHHSPIPANSASAPGYVLLEHKEHPDHQLELRANVQWMGRSGARHECDISAIPVQVSLALRNSGGGYPRGLPVAAIECKDRIDIGSLDETRELLARMYDLALVTKPASGLSCRLFEWNTSKHWGKWRSRYLSFFEKGTFGIVRAGTFQSGAAKLASHYHITHHPSIYSDSLSLDSLLTSFRDTLAKFDSL